MAIFSLEAFFFHVSNAIVQRANDKRVAAKTASSNNGKKRKCGSARAH